ncbi:MAG: hypothetical protein IJ325_03350 [Clostridia bacterium]|nr:hypothetical protein [Clostridia bacterium]
MFGRTAVLGGIDIYFLTTKSPKAVFTHRQKMPERSFEHGGHTRGSGNSIPDFVLKEYLLTMISAAHEFMA